MPVPVPIRPRHSTHQVVKSHNSAQEILASVPAGDFAGDSACKYVIPCQPGAPLTRLAPLCNSQEIHTYWTGNKPLNGLEDNFRLATSFLRSQASQESSGLQCGLIAADNAVVSKQRHAEACHSPVHRSGYLPSTMGLQHYSKQLGSSESTWSGYDADDDVYVGVVPPKGETQCFDQRNGHSTYHDEDSSLLNCGDRCLVFEHVEQPSEKIMLQDTTTPFAEYVDRIVASDATHASDHFIMDAQNTLPPVDTPRRQQQPATAEPLTDPAYIKTYRAIAEPLSNWMADYVWKICTTGLDLPQRFIGVGPMKLYSEKPPSALARSTHSLLCSTLLQPSAIILSLWYITRLPVFFGGETSDINLSPSERDFRKELLGEGQFYPLSGDRNILESRAPFRMILLGCMLANKWLDDHTFSNKTWQSISEVPIQNINCLEHSALAVLSHDLTIKPEAWESWLSHLRRYQSSLCPYPAPIQRPSTIDSSIVVRKMIETLIQSQTPAMARADTLQPVFIPLFDGDNEKKVEMSQTNLFDPYEIDLDEDGPLREEYIPKRRTSHSRMQSITHGRIASDAKDSLQIQSSPSLPPPSKWSPQADPPLERERRHGDNYFAAPPGSEHTSHSNFFSEYSQHPTWGTQAIPSLSSDSFQSHQINARTLRPNHVFQSLALGLPYPAISHARSTLTSVNTATSQSSAHIRTYSHFQPCNDGYCLPLNLNNAHISSAWNVQTSYLLLPNYAQPAKRIFLNLCSVWLEPILNTRNLWSSDVILAVSDTSRENHYDKIKRKALLAPNSLANDGFAAPMPVQNENQMIADRHSNKGWGNMFANSGAVNFGAVVGGMEANGIQRTPIRGGGMNGNLISDWQPMTRHDPPAGFNSFLAASGSERSASADEVENILGQSHQANRQYMRPSYNAVQYTGRMMGVQPTGKLCTQLGCVQV
ncbi:hypothetical protein EW145_g1563 [Phellinidium pouzarii]|uniref:Uncharacterized protein n=1 Tax=Phellinidium pouzarii TaxID=167371 RepID=A0A4S4LEL0_9AGAM|nr:hypothetical protein EW145_g1563 [Phellinidium pouzarii]